jgi:predicted ester cyclase
MTRSIRPPNLLLIVATTLVACMGSAATGVTQDAISPAAKCDPAAAPTSRNKCNLLRLFDEVINGGELDVADALMTVDRPDHDPNLPEDLRRGREGFKKAIGMFRAAFPDLHVTSEFAVADGDRVASYNTVTGTNDGPFLGQAPTHRTFTIVGTDVVRFDEAGLIAEHWGGFDVASILTQVGLPADAQAVATKNVADAYFASWADLKAGDERAVRALLTDDVVFHGTIAPLLSGADAFVSGLKQLVVIDDRRKVVAEDYSGDEAFVLYDITTSTPAGTIRFADHLRVDQGKIVEDYLVFDATELRKLLP